VVGTDGEEGEWEVRAQHPKMQLCKQLPHPQKRLEKNSTFVSMPNITLIESE